MTRGKDIVARSSQCPRLAVHYEGIVSKILQWKDSSGLAAGECMALGQSHDYRFHQHWMEDEAFQFSNIYPAENNVESIAFYLFNQLDSVALGQCHGHPWKGLAELADYARYQWMKRRRTRKRHRDSTFLAARCAPCRFNRAIEVGECRTGTVKEGVAGVRQLDAARYAAEQLYLDLLLDRLDEAAERRLRDAKALRRAGDVPFLGDRDDVAVMPQFHCHTL
jgi:hypothetical protein